MIPERVIAKLPSGTTLARQQQLNACFKHSLTHSAHSTTDHQDSAYPTRNGIRLFLLFLQRLPITSRLYAGVLRRIPHLHSSRPSLSIIRMHHYPNPYTNVFLLMLLANTNFWDTCPFSLPVFISAMIFISFWSSGREGREREGETDET